MAALVWRDTASNTGSVAYSSSPRGKRCKPHPSRKHASKSRRNCHRHQQRASFVRLRPRSRRRGPPWPRPEGSSRSSSSSQPLNQHAIGRSVVCARTRALLIAKARPCPRCTQNLLPCAEVRTRCNSRKASEFLISKRSQISQFSWPLRRSRGLVGWRWEAVLDANLSLKETKTKKEIGY